MPIDDASRAKNRPPRAQDAPQLRHHGPEVRVVAREMEDGARDHGVEVAIGKAQALQGLHAEVRGRQPGSQLGGELTDLLDRARRGVHRAHVEAVAEEIRQVAPGAAARIQHAHARREPALEELVEEIDVDRAEELGQLGRRQQHPAMIGQRLQSGMPGATLTGLPLADLADLLGSRTRALAVRRWLFETRPLPAELPARIAGVSTRAWSAVREAAPLPAWRVAQRQEAPDGTTKVALELNGATVETVLIPAEDRTTVCVSSQAGCTRHCQFCATATIGFARNLTAGEIVLQYAVARAAAPPERPARNVVFMGMGEPMDNLGEVLTAVNVLTEEAAPRLSSATSPSPRRACCRR
jgi:hypothetical protein